ncbi:MAG: BamA/TamA family outer membrane protein [Myxococcales bacterium]|nr:BamA/TamA family outer membrane protein [Myxococcales bacterium]
MSRVGIVTLVLSLAAAALAQPSQPSAPDATADTEPADGAAHADTATATDADTDTDPDTDPDTAPDPDPDADTVTDPADPPIDTDFFAPDDDPALLADVRVRYRLENIELRGNTRTRERVLRPLVPFEIGEILDPEDPALEVLRGRLRGTGWFDEVTLRLEPGARRGWVILVIEVQERNTLVVSGLTLGISEGIRASVDTAILPYVGFTLSDTNFLGTGSVLSGSLLLSSRAKGFRFEHEHPRLLRDWSLRAAGFFHRARQVFGNEPLIDVGECPRDDEACISELEARNAVVFYQRGGVVLGTGRELGANLSFHLDWQGELVHLRSRPAAGSETRGTEIRPIDFAIEDGVSFVSMLRFGLVYDRRDDPAIPTRGVLVRFTSELAHPVLGSDYSFVRSQFLVRGWVPLPWNHTLRLSFFGGGIIGDAPFFHLFHIADLTDLVPGRMLEMQLDRRPAPNLLNTAIATMRAEEVAARLDVQYELPLYRNRRRGFRGLDAYVNVGVLMLADWRDLRVAVPGYVGISRAPLDLTFDIGLRMDTRVGTFQLGFSTLLGFL